jgi:hypothetical protein
LFVKENFGIKLEIVIWCIGFLPFIIGSIITVLPFYNVAEGYFPVTNFYTIGLTFFNIVTISVPIIKSFTWKLWSKKDLENLKPYFINDEEKINLLKELVNGSDPNSNYKYILCVIDDENGINFLKEYSKSEFSIENVK